MLVLSGFAITDILKKNGYIKSRLFLVNFFPAIESAKVMYQEGNSNMKFWVKSFCICGILIVPLSIIELIFSIVIK